jgi:hypothetical protein
LENIDFMQIYRDNVTRLQAAQAAKAEKDDDGSNTADA